MISTKGNLTLEDIPGGIPTKEKHDNMTKDKDAFEAGKTYASLTQQKKDVEQASQISLMQQMLAMQKEMELKTMMADLQVKQQTLDQQMAQVLQSMPSQMPPLDLGGMPPEMSGQLPLEGMPGMEGQQMPPQGMQQMPPEQSQGMGQPPPFM